jgi:TRAP-type C4-dicarboxylate transport system substrate-binding protein
VIASRLAPVAAACIAFLAAMPLAQADRRVLRIATAAPDGSSWARELKAESRELETASHGSVAIKWYFGSIAGTELEVENRIRRGQLDGVASGGILCMRLAPTMRVARIPGLFQSREEVQQVLNRLRPDFEAELQQKGFLTLGWGGFGFDAVFSREPITSMEGLKRGKFWLWSLDPVWQLVAQEMGIGVVATEPGDAMKAYEGQNLQGLIGNPSVALAFQWSTEARYFTPLHAAFLPVCLLVTTAAFDSLNTEAKEALRTASAKMLVRVNAVSEDTDRALLDGLFEKQGLRKAPVSPQFRRAFLDEARRAREALGDRLVPPALLKRVNEILVELRAK